MCGISGLVDRKNSGNKLKFNITRMVNTMAHRGPDSSNVYIKEYFALGHNRLSIQDLTFSGNQPMQLSENSPVIVFNGEIYNFIDLRTLLQKKGCVFKSTSDTEVILFIYQIYGLKGFQMLEGIFSFALLVPNEKKVILLRDRLGVKPLFYSFKNGILCFGSEIKSLLQVIEKKRAVNQQAFSEYLWYGNSYEDRTIYEDIKSLKPGHQLIYSQNNISIRSWWKVEDYIENDITNPNYKSSVHELQDKLNLSVKRQLIADVPVSLFLSGGIDSSAIAAYMSKNNNKSINSYSVGFDYDKGVDELSMAQIVANHCGLNFNSIKIEGKNLEETIINLVKAHDEPFADAANIPLYLLCQQLKNRVKVVMQGDGGDEMFMGYRRYIILSKLFQIRPFTKLYQKVFKNPQNNYLKRIKRLATIINEPNPALRMAFLLTMETTDESPLLWLNKDTAVNLKKETDPFIAYKKAYNRFKDFDLVKQMQLTDITLQLPSQFLTKVDRSTMSWGIEARVPLLDEKIIKFALNIPTDWKIKRNKGKRILRDSIKGLIPSKVVNARKTGFGVPYSYWLRKPLFEFSKGMIMDSDIFNDFGFNKQKVYSGINDHKNGTADYGFMIWKILQLSIWKSFN